MHQSISSLPISRALEGCGIWHFWVRVLQMPMGSGHKTQGGLLRFILLSTKSTGSYFSWEIPHPGNCQVVKCPTCAWGDGQDWNWLIHDSTAPHLNIFIVKVLSHQATCHLVWHVCFYAIWRHDMSHEFKSVWMHVATKCHMHIRSPHVTYPCDNSVSKPIVCNAILSGNSSPVPFSRTGVSQATCRGVKSLCVTCMWFCHCDKDFVDHFRMRKLENTKISPVRTWEAFSRSKMIGFCFLY